VHEDEWLVIKKIRRKEIKEGQRCHGRSFIGRVIQRNASRIKEILSKSIGKDIEKSLIEQSWKKYNLPTKIMQGLLQCLINNDQRRLPSHNDVSHVLHQIPKEASTIITSLSYLHHSGKISVIHRSDIYMIRDFY
jgi:hemin uptake protein HemP